MLDQGWQFQLTPDPIYNGSRLITLRASILCVPSDESNDDDEDLFERNTGKDTGVGGTDDDGDDSETEYGAVDPGFEEDAELFDELDEDDDEEPLERITGDDASPGLDIDDDVKIGSGAVNEGWGDELNPSDVDGEADDEE